MKSVDHNVAVRQNQNLPYDPEMKAMMVCYGRVCALGGIPAGQRDSGPSCKPAKADSLWQSAWRATIWLITLDYSILMQAVFSRVSDLDILAPIHAKHTGREIFLLQKMKIEVASLPCLSSSVKVYLNWRPKSCCLFWTPIRPFPYNWGKYRD